MNAHIAVGGDLLIATVDGIVPMSQRDHQGPRPSWSWPPITRTIKPMWRERGRSTSATTRGRCCKWDEYGGIFTTLPGDLPGKQKCLVTNAATGACARFTGWDAMCFMRMRGDMFFGTQSGIDHAGRPHRLRRRRAVRRDAGRRLGDVPVAVADRHVAAGARVVLRHAPASRSCRSCRRRPTTSWCSRSRLWRPSTPARSISGTGAVGHALWDAGAPPPPVVRNTGWVSIGMTGSATRRSCR